MNRSKRWGLHRAARGEIAEAATFYAQCSQGLGDRFLDATESGILKIRESPGRFRQIEQNLYQCRIAGFPYAIIYLYRAYSIGTGTIYAKYFFKQPNLCLPFRWDIKKSIKEIVSGTNLFYPVGAQAPPKAFSGICPAAVGVKDKHGVFVVSFLWSTSAPSR